MEAPRIWSTPRYCSCRASSQLAGDSSRTPRAVPPQASTDCTAATERALPKPLAAGICARRQARLLPSLRRIPALASAADGAPAPRPAEGAEAVLISGQSPDGEDGGAMPAATRWSCSAASPMWKSAPSGPAISSAKKPPRGWPVIRRTTSPTMKPWVSEW